MTKKLVIDKDTVINPNDPNSPLKVHALPVRSWSDVRRYLAPEGTAADIDTAYVETDQAFNPWGQTTDEIRKVTAKASAWAHGASDDASANVNAEGVYGVPVILAMTATDLYVKAGETVTFQSSTPIVLTFDNVTIEDTGKIQILAPGRMTIGNLEKKPKP